MNESLPDQLVADLGRPSAYPDDPSAADGVETLQTHISHLFFTRDRVVKLRKAVKLAFLDFSQRAERVADCHREVELNARLAPDVYLGVAAMREVGGHFEVRDRWEAKNGSEGPECVVVMRRLEDGRDALTLLQRGELEPEHLDAVAAKLSRFHARVGLGRPAPWDPEGWWEHCFHPVEDTLSSLMQMRPDDFPASELTNLVEQMRESFARARERLEQRRLEGRAVDGHGDVHLQHVWFERHATEPILIDCLEFDAALRRVDAANEVAFLSMDLAYRDREDLAARFLRRYATARDDFGLFGVVDAYESYRAAVRAKVAALAARDPRISSAQRSDASESACRHLALAARCIGRRGPGALVLVSGTVGVGKSTVAEELAERIGGVAISSDRTRKSLAGIPAEVHDAKARNQGIYTPENTDLVYRALLERAEPVVHSGRVAILDASFARAEHRKRARAWARQRGLQAVMVQVDCDEKLVMERIRRRSELGMDPSDAGPDFVEFSRANFEPPEDWPKDDLFQIRTDRAPDNDALLEAVANRLRIVAPDPSEPPKRPI